MPETHTIQVIARIKTDFSEKFGIPRQSGLVQDCKALVVFEPEFRNPDALRGLEDFSHIWILWQFSESIREDFSPTVRPPRLGGEKRKGVFATRSPFRPNAIAMSCVKLKKIEHTKNHGTVLYVTGVDMMNGTPVLDIKPYITYTDSHTDAKQGFAEDFVDYSLHVVFPDELLQRIPKNKQDVIIGILKQDPRPSYQTDRSRIYGMKYLNFDIKFKVDNKILYVVDVI